MTIVELTTGVLTLVTKITLFQAIWLGLFGRFLWRAFCRGKR